MMHYRHYTRTKDMKLMTEVVIPPTLVKRLEFYVINLIFKFGGQNIDIPLYFDGPMVVEV